MIAMLGEDHPTLALDLPGFGKAAAAPGPYTVAAYADHVEACVRALGVDGFVLVGHSMGGKVALALAARRPRGLRSLVLLAPSPPTPEPIEDDARAALIAGWAQYGAASQTLARSAARPLSDAQRRLAIDDIMLSGKAAWTAWLEHGSREDISAEMPGVAVPVAVLSGTCDRVIPTAVIEREVAGRVADARVTTVPGAGHLLPVEAPDAVAAAIRRAAGEAGEMAYAPQRLPATLRSRAA